MNVLIVTSAKSGPLKNAHTISRYLSIKKNNVYLYLLDSPEYDLDFINIIVDKPRGFLEPLGYFSRVVRTIELTNVEFCPDVILTSFAFIIPFLKAIFRGVPIVYRMMGIPRVESSEGLLKLAYTIEMSLAKRYAKEFPTITVAEYIREQIRKEWKVDARYIHNMVDTEFYRPEDKIGTKNKLGLEGYDCIVTLGLTRYDKAYKPKIHLEWYLDVLFQNREKNILTIILGKTDSKQREEVQEIIDGYTARAGTSNHSFKIDYFRDTYLLRQHYQISDIFISFMPQSLMEKEALSCGIPVVTEFWEGQNASRMLAKLQHKSVKKEFVRIVNTLLHDGKIRATFSKKARAIAEKDFSYENMGEEYLQILKSAIRSEGVKM